MNEIGCIIATINKIQTTIDGGARLTLDVGQDSSDVIQKLIKIKMSKESVLQVGLIEMEKGMFE